MNKTSDPSEIKTPRSLAWEPYDLLPNSAGNHHEDPFATLFRKHSAAAPIVRWNPGRVDMADPVLEGLATFATDHMNVDGTVPMTAFEDLSKLSHITDWLMLVRTIRDGDDFVYDHYGHGIAQNYGRDMTGTQLSGFANHIGTFFAAIYRAALSRRQWVMTIHEPPDGIFVQSWRRLVIPLSDASGDHFGFAVANVPENTLRAGLEAVPDPAVVVDDAQNVQFSNTAARSLLGISPKHLGQPLFDATGIALPPDISARSLDTSGAVRTMACLSISNGIVASVTVTASATRLGTRPFLLLIVRPEAPR